MAQHGRRFYFYMKMNEKTPLLRRGVAFVMVDRGRPPETGVVQGMYTRKKFLAGSTPGQACGSMMVLPEEDIMI